MSELLTTGEMIDRLKVGEIAESENGDKVIRTESGSIDYTDSLREVSLTHHIIQPLWRILPNYVSFEEAIQALKNGKTVAYLDKLGNLRKVYPREFKINRISSYEIGGHSLLNLYDGKWTIVED